MFSINISMVYIVKLFTIVRHCEIQSKTVATSLHSPKRKLELILFACVSGVYNVVCDLQYQTAETI